MTNAVLSEKNLINTIYDPPKGNGGDVLGSYQKFGHGLIQHSFARNAIYDILKRISVKNGDIAYVPSFICRDVLSPFNSMGMKIRFYEIDLNLNAISSFDLSIRPKVVLGVHYFGLESSLSDLMLYCESTDAVLVIDNAHGFLSKNTKGRLLGCEGDWGVISVRKTLPIPNGALLIGKTLAGFNKNNAMIIGHGFTGKLKSLLRPMIHFTSPTVLNFIVNIKRILRKVITGQEVPTSLEEDEVTLPPEAPIYEIGDYLESIDITKEIRRRRDLFELCVNLLVNQPVKFIRSELAAGECPYVFPFVCEPDKVEEVRLYLKEHNLELVNWPALPTEVVKLPSSSFYKNVYFIKFLW